MSSANSRQLSWTFLAEFNAADRGHDTPAGASVWFSRRLVQLGADAVERGIAPGSPDAAEVLSALLGDADPATVLIRLRSHATHRVARYRELLAVVKGAGPEAAYRAEFAWGGRRAGGAHGRLI
ncbi:hypothetical protein RFN58_29625 [Streptomyces iakyrus]|uniref:hypothetical protein n=1 Tax=Streptomyces iakyrus TaxID=68219 RepID=UPI000526590C|nr:hypothetical protein [Streptomyces iakyrus]